MITLQHFDNDSYFDREVVKKVNAIKDIKNSDYVLVYHERERVLYEIENNILKCKNAWEDNWYTIGYIIKEINGNTLHEVEVW